MAGCHGVLRVVIPIHPHCASAARTMCESPQACAFSTGVGARVSARQACTLARAHGVVGEGHRATRYLGSFIFLLITTADLARLQGACCSAAGVVDVAAVHSDRALEAAVRAHGRAVCVVARAHRVCPTYTSAGRPSGRGRARSRRCATSREDRVVARGCQRTRDRRRAARTDVEDDVAHAAGGGIDDAAVRRGATRTAP